MKFLFGVFILLFSIQGYSTELNCNSVFIINTNRYSESIRTIENLQSLVSFAQGVRAKNISYAPTDLRQDDFKDLFLTTLKIGFDAVYGKTWDQSPSSDKMIYFNLLYTMIAKVNSFHLSQELKAQLVLASRELGTKIDSFEFVRQPGTAPEIIHVKDKINSLSSALH